MHRFTLVYLFFSGLVVSSLAVNVIVDDANSSWTFSGSWNAITPADPCSGCLIQPVPSMAFNQTWHDTDAPGASAELRFNGISIQIYTICANDTIFGTNFSFTLDGAADGSFMGPFPYSIWIYNYLVYARTNLTDGPHSIVISNNPSSPGSFNQGDLLLDYAIYDDGTSSPAPTVTLTSTVGGAASNSHSSVPTGAMVAISVIAAFLLIVILALLSWYRRSKKLQSHVDGDGMSPPIP
jgi:hypothetical protein